MSEVRDSVLFVEALPDGVVVLGSPSATSRRTRCDSRAARALPRSSRRRGAASSARASATGRPPSN